uniref:Variant surface glycoprotein 1125.1391 n=1 Tax=Trypanosoma brucei TaxID=5691 RepID=A0A1J0R6V8_9TRYP|nr:variant surface glycoprotein 1125.1391 [Trypanosoma brucei]
MPKHFFYVTVVAILCNQAAAGPKGGNVEVMAKLCDALRLGDAPIAFEPQEETGFEGEPTVLKLNMSLAPKDWRDRFVKRSGTTKVEPIETAPAGTPDDWRSMWPRWAAIEAGLRQPDAEMTLLKAYNIETTGPEQKELIRHHIAAYADAALAAMKISETKPTDADDNALTAAINTAIYGAGKDGSKELDRQSLTGQTGQAYGVSCGETSAVEQSKTLAHAVACVCGTAQAKNNEEPCITDGTGNVQWQASNMPQAAQWNKIRAACPKIKPTAITAERIRTAVGAASSAIITDGTHAYIDHMDTDCDGHSNTACPRLTNAEKNDGEPLTKVLWLQHLAAVATKLEQRQKYNMALAKQKSEIQTIDWQVKALTK